MKTFSIFLRRTAVLGSGGFINHAYYMLPKKAVLEFKQLVEKHLGKKITYTQAEKWAENFYQLMLLIITPVDPLQ